MEIKFHHLTTHFVILTVVSLLSACGGNISKKPTSQILVDAHTAYETAKQNPITSKNSLYEAEKALNQAEMAQNTQEVAHLAYIAKRKAEIAVFVGERVAAENERVELVKSQDQTIMHSRELKAEKVWQATNVLGTPKKKLNTQTTYALQRQLAEFEGKSTNKGLRLTLTLGDRLFETGKADLLSSALGVIKKVATFLVAHPQRNILIEGHTDNVGTPEYNMGLSDRRANAVRFALIKKGVASNRILARGLGETLAIASNRTAAGRKKNRRIEMTILNVGKTFH